MPCSRELRRGLRRPQAQSYLKKSTSCLKAWRSSRLAMADPLNRDLPFEAQVSQGTRHCDSPNSVTVLFRNVVLVQTIGF